MRDDAGMTPLPAGSPAVKAPKGTVVAPHLRHGALTAGLIVVLVWVLFAALYTPGYAGSIVVDSACYLDCARNIASGRGLLVRNLYHLGPETYAPIALWPPGYPLLIAAFIKLGMSAYHAGLAVNIISAGVASLLILYVSLSMFPWSIGLPLTLLIVSTPSFVAMGTGCMSEAPYFMLVLLSLLCMIRATQYPSLAPLWAALAGLLAGWAWCVRNLGIALLATSACYLAYCLIRHRRGGNVRACVLWFVGWISGAGWLLCWNLWTFGRIKPYDMPPSKLSLFTNIRDMYHALAVEMSGFRAVGDALTHAYAVLGLSTLIALLLVTIRLRGQSFPRPREGAYEKRYLLLLGSLAFFTLATVIGARTRYQWGEPITARHVSSVIWIFWFLFVQAVIHWGTRAGIRTSTLTIALIIALSMGVAVQVWRQQRMHAWGISMSKWITAAQMEDFRRRIPRGQYVLSDRAAVLSGIADVDARVIRPDNPADTKTLSWEDIRGAGARGLLWGILVSNRADFLDRRYGEALNRLAGDPNGCPEFRARDFGTRGLELRYVRASLPEGSTE